MVFQCSKCGKICYNASNDPKKKPPATAHGPCGNKVGKVHNWVVR